MLFFIGDSDVICMEDKKVKILFREVRIKEKRIVYKE